MSRLRWSLLALVFVLGAGIGTLVLAAGPIASRLAQDRLMAATGRAWTVSLDPGLDLTPSPTLVLRNVAARVALDGGAAVRIEAKGVRLGGSLSDWTGGGRLPLVELDGPVVEIPAQWWRYGSPAPGTGAVPTNGFTVDRVLVRGGSFLVRAGSTLRQAATEVDLDATRNPADGALAVKALARLGGEPVRADLSLGAPAGGASPLTFTLRAARIPDAAIEGSADVALDGAYLVLSRLAGTIGAKRFAGAFLADLAGKPNLRLDLNLPALALPQGAPDDGPAWRLDAESFGLLREFDGRLKVVASSLDLPSPPVSVKDLAIEVQVADGTLTATLSRAGLYDGQVKGILTLTAAEGRLKQVMEGEITGVRGLPLLTDLFAFTLIDGRASGRLAVQGAGWTSTELVRNLVGEASLDVRDGRLNAIDLSGLGRLAVAQLPSLTQRRDAETTAFDRFSARFKVRDGRAATDDLALQSPLVTATGAGSIDLVARTLDFRVDSRLLAKGGIAKGLDVNVPVVIEGPLAAPRLAPDLKSVTSGGRPIPGLEALGGLLGGALGGGGPASGAPGGGARGDGGSRGDNGLGGLLGGDGKGLGAIIDGLMGGAPGAGGRAPPGRPSRP